MRTVVLLLWLVIGCGTNNVAEPYSELTPDEKAKKALDEGRYRDAAESYRELIEAQPSVYRRYPLLAAAHAGEAGLNIVEILKAQMVISAGSGSVFDVVGAFVPARPSGEELHAIQNAVAILRAMPEEHRTGSRFDYASGAGFQLSLFLTASSAMVLNQFARPDGSFTPESLAGLTDAEVDVVLANLGAIIATQATTADQDALQGKAQATLDAINSQSGPTARARLTQYLLYKSTK